MREALIQRMLDHRFVYEHQRSDYPGFPSAAYGTFAPWLAVFSRVRLRCYIYRPRQHGGTRKDDPNLPSRPKGFAVQHRRIVRAATFRDHCKRHPGTAEKFFLCYINDLH